MSSWRRSAVLQEIPDVTPVDLIRNLELLVSEPRLSRTVRKPGSIRRRQFMLLNRSVPDVQTKRGNWHVHLDQLWGIISAATSVSVVEGGANINIERRCERVVSGEHVMNYTPAQRAATAMVISAATPR